MPQMVKVPKGQLEEMRKEIDRIKTTIETLEDKEVIQQIVQSEKEFNKGKGKSWKEISKEL